MSDNEISQIISAYSKENFSPNQAQRDDITRKYNKLCGFLGNNCFQSGSYARFTAINPAHDLDIIYVLSDNIIPKNPEIVMTSLRDKLVKDYASDRTVKEVSSQTHSVTIIFDNNFSIDVVPAVELNDKNTFGNPKYNVPEIAKYDHAKRIKVYNAVAKGERTINWIKSDPKGYITAATNLDNVTSGTFRKTVKTLKSWRHAQRQKHEDNFILKSFHLEQICDEFLTQNKEATLYESIIGCLDLISQRLDRPHYPDRADNTQYIDQYVNDKMTDTSRALVLSEQQAVHEVFTNMVKATSANDIIDALDTITTGTKKDATTISFGGGGRIEVAPRQPWGY